MNTVASLVAMMLLIMAPSARLAYDNLRSVLQMFLGILAHPEHKNAEVLQSQCSSVRMED